MRYDWASEYERAVAPQQGVPTRFARMAPTSYVNSAPLNAAIHGWRVAAIRPDGARKVWKEAVTDEPVEAAPNYERMLFGPFT